MGNKIVIGIGIGIAALGIGIIALGALGFTAVGPAAGSIATGVQSMFYGGKVASGSLFATLQSLGMTLGGIRCGITVGVGIIVLGIFGFPISGLAILSIATTIVFTILGLAALRKRS